LKAIAASLLMLSTCLAAVAGGRKHIILFLTEDQSPHLGCLGTKGLETPQLDKLGNSGVIFERAFALSPVCSPSKMALFTGTYPHMNGGRRNVRNYGTDFPLKGDPSDLSLGGVREDLPSLIEILRARGWHTAISSKTHVQPIRKFPYHQGFPNPSTPAAARRIIRETAEAAGDKPIFLCFNIGSPHLPFRSIPAANGKWDPRGGLIGDGGVTNIDPRAIDVPDSLPDVPGVRQDIADYLGAIGVFDSIYAAARDSLAEQGMLDQSLVVFTSDHGIGLHRFKQSIYGLHIPLLIDGPGINGGRRIKAPVSHLDLAPTFLDFAGIDIPPTMLGKSLLPVLSGASDLGGRRTVFTSCHEKYEARAVCDGRHYFVHNLRQVAGASLKRPEKALNADQFKAGHPWFNRAYPATLAASASPQRELLRRLVEGDLPEFELYDLDADPWCVSNLADDTLLTETRARLSAELKQWRETTGDSYNAEPPRKPATKTQPPQP
jgi:N-sulfoglucosamine sulfohydrolase